MVQIIRPVPQDTGITTDIPVKGQPTYMIQFRIAMAVDLARRSPDESFEVPAKGWGHPAKVIAPMFDHSPMNVSLPYEFMY